ncbi:MAG: CrcB family protein [Xanthomonadales bacterium]|nr:CrcB family protein [Xanthomonadales bacterium]
MSGLAAETLPLAVGGALGGLARALLSGWVTRLGDGVLPWGTLAVNLSGALLAGLGLGLAERGTLPPQGAAVLLGGVLGAYTTVSSLALQTLTLAESGRRRAALGFLLAHAGLGLPLAAVGQRLAELLDG